MKKEGWKKLLRSMKIFLIFSSLTYLSFETFEEFSFDFTQQVEIFLCSFKVAFLNVQTILIKKLSGRL